MSAASASSAFAAGVTADRGVLARSTIVGEPRFVGLARRLSRVAAAMLDDLVPPSGGHEQELPPEWFKFPPI